MKSALIAIGCGILTIASPLAQPAAPELATARTAAAALPQMHSLLLSHHGRLIFEYYAPRHGPTRLANIKSASKSIISALVGVAIDQGLIGGLDESISRWFTELGRDADPRKRTITIGDLVTMRSGLASTSGEHYGAWVSSRNWVQSALARPMIGDPGTSMEYSTGTSHILSAILTKASGRSTRQYANEVLGASIGFSFANWLRDPQGIYFGGNEMQMTPRQMVAFGELYLNGGRAGGRQVVPADWVERSCVPVTRSRFDDSREYGLGWWVQDIGGHRACFAWGYGGQYIMFFRDLNLVVVVTSSPDVSDERHGYRREIFRLLSTHVLPAVNGA